VSWPRAVALVSLLLPALAWPSAFEIEARTEAQVSSWRAWRGGGPSDFTILPRRRLVQYLGLDAFELVTGQPIGFESSLRVFADWGLPRGESSRLDGARSEDADLMYANAYYRSNTLSVRLGRQTIVDLMDIASFDGAHVRYVHPFSFGGLGAEAYGGLWVKASSPLGSSVYQPDGIRESDLRRVAAETAPPYAALDDIEPLFGAKLLMENVKGISAAAGFRQSWLSGKTDVQRFSVEAKYGRGRGINALGGLEYDLVTSRVSNARLQGRFDASEFSVTGEFVHVTPTLSADSIFLYFVGGAHDGVRARADYYPSGWFRFYGQFTSDFYATPINSSLGTADEVKNASSPISIGGSFGTGARLPASLKAGADLTFKTGYGGRQVWFDLSGGWAREGLPFTIDARISWVHVADALNNRLVGGFFGAQLWGSYFLGKNVRASVMVEENVSKYSNSDFKVFAVLDWKVLL